MPPPIIDDCGCLETWQKNLLGTDVVLEKARDSGFIDRLRKLQPVYLLYILIFGISSHCKPSFEEIYRRYIDFDDTPHKDGKIRRQSFSNRFNEKLVKFLHEMLLYYIDLMLSESSAKLKGAVQDLNDIIIQDSTIIRLSNKLVNEFPATRSSSNAAGLKIHAVYSAIHHSLTSAEITGERVHDSKMHDLGLKIKNVLFLFDLGYYKHSTFANIDAQGGFFISRLKSNAKPKVAQIFSSSILAKKQFQEGMKLKDFLKKIPKRGTIDLLCTFNAKLTSGEGKSQFLPMNFRVVCFWDEKKSIWRSYVSNLPGIAYNVKEVYHLYRYRWIIELLFKELKGDYGLGNLLLAKTPLAYVHIYSMLIRLVLSRDLYKLIIKTTKKEEQNRYGPLLWSKVFAEQCLEFLSILCQNFFGKENVKERWKKLELSLRHLSKSRHKIKRLSLEFITF